jgi:hypothetical protein
VLVFLQVRVEKVLIPQSDQGAAKLPGQIDAARFLALQSSEFPRHKITTNPDKAIGVLFALAKLYVTSAKSQHLASAHPSAGKRQEPRVMLWADFLDRVQETFQLRFCECHWLKLLSV